MRSRLLLIAPLFTLFGLTACAPLEPVPVVEKRPEVKAVPQSTFFPAPASMVGNAVGYDKHGMPTYKHNVRKRYVRATAYSHQENEPGAPGRKNAAGTNLKFGSNIRSAAADWSLYPLGTKFKVKGLPYTYVVDDYGSALVGTNTVDMYFPSLRQMNRWGTRKIEITVIQWGDAERSLRLLRGRCGYKHCRSMYYALKRRQAAMAQG